MKDFRGGWGSTTSSVGVSFLGGGGVVGMLPQKTLKI